MNKLFLTLVISLISLLSIAQSNDLTKEIEGKIEFAKERFDKEIKNPELNQKAETWYLYAYVYKEIAKSEVYAKLDATPEEKSVKAIEKCKSIDTKQVYYSEIISLMLELGPIIYNKAIKNYNLAVNNNNNAEQYAVATYYFELFYRVIDVLGKDDKRFIDQFIEYNGINPKKTYLFAGFAEDQIGKFNQAHKFYNKVIDLQASNEHEKINSFSLIYYYEAELLIREGKNEQAELVLDKALEVWPNNKEIVVLSINFYKNNNKEDKLADVMKTAVKNNPKNITLLYTLARNYNNISKGYIKNGYISTAQQYQEEAISTYKKAIELGTENKGMEFGLNYNLAIIFFNKAAQMYKSQTGGVAEYQNILKQALPYLEKAHELDKANANVIKMLKKVYQTLEMNDKYNTIQAE